MAAATRALVLLGRGNLRSLVVVIILAIFAQMTLKGLIRAPRELPWSEASQTTQTVSSLPALLSSLGLSAIAARMLAASVMSAALIHLCVCLPRRSVGHSARSRPASPSELLIAAGWYASGYLGADDFNPTAGGLALTFIRADRRRPAIRHAVDRNRP